MAKNNEAKVEYHYDQQQQNRDTVRAQGAAINSSLKKLKKISSKEFEVPEVTEHDDESTQQHVTIPNVKPVNLRLKKAMEEAEEACRKSKAPPAKKKNGTAAKKRKRWFDWAD